MESQSRFFKDGVLTTEEAHEIFSPHYDDIMQCVYKGINAAEELRQREPEYCHALTSRSWASIVHDHMEFEARRVFGAAGSGVAVYSETGFLIVDFYEHIFLRFKKLRQNLSPCNIETEQQRAFDSQTLFRGPVTLVTAGYRLNDLGLYRDAHIVCWACGERLWSLRLPESGRGEQGEHSRIAVPPNTDQPIVIVRKSTARKVGDAS
ncbi:MAG: hypothetical protein MUP16_09670 [Sedimentisphaerales bacterium]|nr:hypothetical protein [Sedimentisphaerales bacterium]